MLMLMERQSEAREAEGVLPRPYRSVQCLARKGILDANRNRLLLWTGYAEIRRLARRGSRCEAVPYADKTRVVLSEIDLLVFCSWFHAASIKGHEVAGRA